MKKLLLIKILCLITSLSAFASLRQAEYRWRNDNGSETAATWKAPSNTPIVHADIDEVLRLRIEFDNSNGLGMSSFVEQQLVYSKDGGATWGNIDESDLNDFKLVSSAFVTHGTATTNLLGAGAGTFFAGFTASQNTPYLSSEVWDNERTEIEWVIQSTLICENFTTYIFAMNFIEAEGVYPELTTNFDCEEPVISFTSTFIERCGPGSFDIEGAIDAEDGIIRYWTAPDGGDLIGSGLNFTTPSYAVNTTIYAEGFGGGCFSERMPIELIVREVPVIDIVEANGTYCAFDDIFTLHTSPEQPATNTILWSTGASTPTIDLAPTSGEQITVWVSVTTEYGCVSSDTIRLIINPSPEVDLGPDVTVCEDGVTILDAGNPGHTYYWSNGSTNQTLEVDDGGQYNVFVTNRYGCIGTDTINVIVSGFSPKVEGIIVDNLGAKTFQFTAYHPANVISYLWDFGDETGTSVSPNPIHSYKDPGTYLVKLVVASDCGNREYFTYATMVLGVDEVEAAENNLKIYPVPAQSLLNIEALNNIKMDRLQVYNMTGTLIIDMPGLGKDQLAIDLNRLPSGMYQLKVDTKDGTMIRKFQILK